MNADTCLAKQGLSLLISLDRKQFRNQAAILNHNRFDARLIERSLNDDVLVNGVPEILEAKLTRSLPGKVLYAPGYQGAR